MKNTKNTVSIIAVATLLSVIVIGGLNLFALNASTSILKDALIETMAAPISVEDKIAGENQLYEDSFVKFEYPAGWHSATVHYDEDNSYSIVSAFNEDRVILNHEGSRWIFSLKADSKSFMTEDQIEEHRNVLNKMTLIDEANGIYFSEEETSHEGLILYSEYFRFETDGYFVGMGGIIDTVFKPEFNDGKIEEKRANDGWKLLKETIEFK